MTNPTPATPTGDSVTNPAGGVRAAEQPGLFSEHRLLDRLDQLLKIASLGFPYGRNRAAEVIAEYVHAETVRRCDAIMAARDTEDTAILAAVEKALAAWDAVPADDIPIGVVMTLGPAMSALRAIHSVTK